MVVDVFSLRLITQCSLWNLSPQFRSNPPPHCRLPFSRNPGIRLTIKVQRAFRPATKSSLQNSVGSVFIYKVYFHFLPDNASTSNDFAANSNSVDRRNLNLNRTAEGKQQQREGESIMLQHFIQSRSTFFILFIYLPFSCVFFLFPSVSLFLPLAQPNSPCHPPSSNQSCFRCCCKSASTASNAAAKSAAAEHALSFIHPTGQSELIIY